MSPREGEGATDKDALRALERPRLYEQLVQRLLAHVVQAGLKPGDRLPPERTLAELLGVSRASVRQAIVVLEVQGALDVRHGDGIYLVRSTVRGEPLSRLVERGRRLPEILETREALEVKLAELAAQRRTDEDLARIGAALAEMGAQIDDGGTGEAGDADFHRAVTQAAHNPLMADLMEHLSEPITETRRESLTQPGRPPMSLESHHRIADAIRHRDSDRAAAEMRAHVKLVGDVWLLRVSGADDLG